MPSNSETILSAQTHPGDSTTETVTGTKYKGDGYYGRADGFHTVQYNLTGFLGTIEMQATLTVEPGDSDWFTLSETAHTVTDTASSDADGGHIYNFTGNYVWVRANVRNWTDGTVQSIILNH